MKKKIKIPKTSIRAGFQPSTFNEEKRTIDVTFSLGTKGKRYSWSVGEYYEELSMKKSSVRLDRLNAGAPVLNNHQRYNGLEGILGVVEKASIKNKEGIATLRFSEREEMQGIIKDIKSGVIRNVSVGYKVHTLEDVSKKGDDIPTYRATDWEPLEISFVDVPFDIKAQSRSQDDSQDYECTIEINEENSMNREEKIRAACKAAGLSDEVTSKLIARSFEIETLDKVIEEEVAEMARVLKAAEPVVVAKPVVEPAVVDEDAIRAEAVKLERSRVNELETAARALDVDAKELKKHIDAGTKADEFRKIIIKAKAESNASIPTNNHSEGNSMDTRELRIKGAEQALLNRYKSSKFELTEAANQFRYTSLINLARNILTANGESVMGMTDNQVAERAMHTSSDFKEILANVTNKSLTRAYQDAPQTFGFMVQNTTVNDFKEISSVSLHGGAALEKVNENGEFKHGTLSESSEKYSLQTFGKIFALTRKTIVNDDLKAFTRVPEIFGRRARALESTKVWEIIGLNPVMGDGVALFHADHGNLAAVPAAIGIGPVGIARESMRLQTDLDGNLIDVIPKFLVTPVTLETVAEQFLGATVPQSDTNVNPFKGKFNSVSEPRLDAYSPTAWYVAAETDQIDIIDIARLAGEEGPRVTTKEGFEVDGMQIKIRYDFAAKAQDWRGLFKNAGV